tara:strand:+ start:11 stop:1141 length:1131 start_codon:yes stop_codon:yes gene_type:complete
MTSFRNIISITKIKSFNTTFKTLLCAFPYVIDRNSCIFDILDLFIINKTRVKILSYQNIKGFEWTPELILYYKKRDIEIHFIEKYEIYKALLVDEFSDNILIFHSNEIPKQVLLDLRTKKKFLIYYNYKNHCKYNFVYKLYNKVDISSESFKSISIRLSHYKDIFNFNTNIFDLILTSDNISANNLYKMYNTPVLNIYNIPESSDHTVDIISNRNFIIYSDDNIININEFLIFYNNVIIKLKTDIKIHIYGKITKFLKQNLNNSNRLILHNDTDIKTIYNNAIVSLHFNISSYGVKHNIIQSIINNVPVICYKTYYNIFIENNVNGIICDSDEEMILTLTSIINDRHMMDKFKHNSKAVLHKVKISNNEILDSIFS